MKLKALSASVALAVGMGLGGTAAAAPTFFGSAGTAFEDDLLDYHIDRNSNGAIDVGDSILAVFSVASTHAVNPAGSSVNIAPPTFAGIIDQFVIGKQSLGGGLFNFAFGANPGGFLAGIPGAPAGAALGAPAGTMARIWDGSTAGLDLAGADCDPGTAGAQATFATCAAAASNGTLFWNVGFTGTYPAPPFTGAPGFPVGNEFLFVLNAFDQIQDVLDETSTSGVAFPRFGMQQLPGGTGPDVLPMLCSSKACPAKNDPDLLVDYLGTGTIQGGKGLPFTGPVDGKGNKTYVSGVDPFARGDFQFEVLTLPEPGSLALLGLALAGFGVAARRRKSSV